MKTVTEDRRSRARHDHHPGEGSRRSRSPHPIPLEQVFAWRFSPRAQPNGCRRTTRPTSRHGFASGLTTLRPGVQEPWPRIGRTPLRRLCPRWLDARDCGDFGIAAPATNSADAPTGDRVVGTAEEELERRIDQLETALRQTIRLLVETISYLHRHPEAVTHGCSMRLRRSLASSSSMAESGDTFTAASGDKWDTILIKTVGRLVARCSWTRFGQGPYGRRTCSRMRTTDACLALQSWRRWWPRLAGMLPARTE